MFVALAPRLPPGARVLDLGSRNPSLLQQLAQRGCHVTAVDPQPPAGGDCPNVAFQQADVEKFVRSPSAASPPPRYDLILLHEILQYIDPTILRELRDWLAPRGLISIMTFAEDDPICQEHQFVPREFIEHVLAPLVKVEDRQYRQLDGPEPRSAPWRHVIELLFQKQ